jgi:hypothetical protein
MIVRLSTAVAQVAGVPIATWPMGVETNFRMKRLYLLSSHQIWLKTELGEESREIMVFFPPKRHA